MFRDPVAHVVLVEDSDEDADTAEAALRRTLLPARMQRVISGEACVAVVVTSTSANPRDVDFCCQAGANACHVKPVHHLEHLGAMTALFEYWLRRVELPMPQPCPR